MLEVVGYKILSEHTLPSFKSFNDKIAMLRLNLIYIVTGFNK